MAYQKINFLDQNVERPRTYEFQQNSDGTNTLIDSFGVITELGTPINAQNMNHIEDGIVNVDNRLLSVESALPNKLNINLDNLPISSKEKITNFPFPDYANGENKSANTNYIANVDGWVKAYLSVFNAGASASAKTITVDGVTVASNNFNALSGAAGTISATFIVPVPKGSTYRSNGEGIVFYPCKGGN